ncbi:FliM/FliN family flagellar motor C-terminal domain-containing protein [Chitiniphilus shinanonensis]|uniref:FliM/FliN family flagellar motor C-terminal domain-containing protein n=1 Tax=Chitiniphilus shinanonensis TaxID=553088 RepID=UPI000A03FAB7|nr:FliM/FliN family flagellar motor C-terminal domain-containing protein [Chitiniphilus shinanonensis]
MEKLVYLDSSIERSLLLNSIRRHVEKWSGMWLRVVPQCEIVFPQAEPPFAAVWLQAEGDQLRGWGGIDAARIWLFRHVVGHDTDELLTGLPAWCEQWMNAALAGFWQALSSSSCAPASFVDEPPNVVDGSRFFQVILSSELGVFRIMLRLSDVKRVYGEDVAKRQVSSWGKCLGDEREAYGVFLPSVELPLSDVLSLELGDTILLDKPVQTRVEVRRNDRFLAECEVSSLPGSLLKVIRLSNER